MNDLSKVLRKASVVASGAAPIFGGTGGAVAGAIGAGLALAADLASAGFEPIAAIHRIRDTLPELAAIDARWDSRMARRFAETAALKAMAPNDSDIGEDIYAALDVEAGAK